MTEPDLEVPEEPVADKYRLTRLLGRGGMGSVWEGVHATLGTRVAVKFIEAEYVDSAEARSRFENEARAAARLRSKHVVQVYDHGVMPDGRPYIVMEFLAGEPLDARLQRLGRLSLVDTANIINQVARALAKAHQVGIVHRDLKPENVFLVWDDDDQADIAKVVDFGIAKFTDSSLGVSSATRTGSVLGTPYFMSPEQARGLRTVDYRSDLWAVGVITYRCVVGRLPFEGEAVGDLLVKICTGPIPVPSQNAEGIPPSFDAWFARALARDPAGRFASAAELAEALFAAVGLPVRREMPSSMVDEVPGAAGVAYAPTQATPAAAGSHTPAAAGARQYPTPATAVAGYAGSLAQQTGQRATSPAANTGAPTTRTAQGSRRSAPLGVFLGAVGAALVVLAIAILAAVKLIGSDRGEEQAAEQAAAAASSVVQAVPVPVPSITPPPEPEQPQSASSAPAPAADAAVAAQLPSAETPAPTVEVPAKPAARVVRRKPPPVVSKPPVAAPKPRPARPRTVDIGY